MADREAASKERGRGRLGDRKGRPPESTDEDTYISPIIKYFLFFFNFVFWLLGCAIISVGIWAYYEKLRLDQSSNESNTEVGLISSLFLNVSIVLMLAGIILFVIAFCGCIGALRESTVLLVIFIAAVSIVLILEIGAAIMVFVFSARAESYVKEQLTDQAIPGYRDDLDLQNLIDWFQETFSCCGSSPMDTGGGYRDWSANEYFSCDGVGVEACGVPYSCCKAPSTEDFGVINTMCGYNAQGVSLAVATTKIHTEGCVSIVKEYLQSNLIWVGGIAAGIIVPQIITLCLSQVLRMQINDQKDRWASVVA